MVITDKQQIFELCHENVIMKHGIINLDLNDYNDCQEVGEEWFAASENGETIEDTLRQLKNEIASYSYNDMKAVLVYLQVNSVDDLDKILVFSAWVNSMPDNILVKWGCGIHDSADYKTQLLMFSFK